MERRFLHLTLLILALALECCGTCFGQDSKTDTTFSSRLSTATHIGLVENERLGGYTVIVYSPDQYKLNLASIEKYKADLDAYHTKIKAIDRRYEAAVASKSSGDQLNAITNERNSHHPPYSQFVQGHISLCRVVAVASDYLEVSANAISDETTLIPLSRICSVRLIKPSIPKSENGNDK